MPQPPRTPQPPQGNRRLPPQQARPPQQRPQQRPPQRPAAPAPSVRLAPGPARQGQFVYAGDQTYEQVQHTREEGRWDSIFVPGVKQFKAATGTNRIRILPGTWDDNPYNNWSYKVYLHKNVGADGGNYLCLNKMRGEACPVCEASLEERNNGDEEAAKKLQYKTDHLMWVIDRNLRKPEPLPQLFELSWFYMQDVLAITADDYSGQAMLVSNLDEGHDLSFIRGEDEYKRPSAWRFSQQGSPAVPPQHRRNLEEFLWQNPIPDLLLFRDYDEIYRKLYGTAATRDQDLDRGTEDGQTYDGGEQADAYYDGNQGDEPGVAAAGEDTFTDVEPEEPGDEVATAPAGNGGDWPEDEPAAPEPAPPPRQARRQPPRQPASRPRPTTPPPRRR